MKIVDLKKDDIVIIKHIYSDYADKVTVIEVTNMTIVLKHENGNKIRWATEKLKDMYIVIEEVKKTRNWKPN